MTRVSYKSIDLKFPVRVFTGRGKVASVEAVAGLAIYRITDGSLDFFTVEGGTALPGVEIDASNVAAGVRAPVAVRARGGKASGTDG